MRKLTSTIIVVMLIITLSGCKQKVKEYSREVFAFNTLINIKIYGNDNVEKVLDKILDRIYEIENRMSITIEDSDVSRINASAGKHPVEVQDDTLFVIKRAVHYSELTNGKFDVSVYPLAKIWDINNNRTYIPNVSTIEDKLDLVNYHNIIINDKEKTIFLKEKGMGIDLGAIAKGYAADEAVRILKEYKVNYGLINMGGNIFAYGSRPDGSPWRVAIRDPRSEDTNKQYLAIAEVKDVAFVSSGDYERYLFDLYEDTGVRFHHILDTTTGYPAKQGLIAVTVLSPNSIDADALSTCVFVLGGERGLKLIESLNGVEALVVTEDMEVEMTEGFKNLIDFKSEGYKFKQ